MNQDLQINENSLVSDIQRPIYISTLADRSNPDYNQPTPAQLNDMAGSIYLPTPTNFKVISVVLHVKSLLNSAVSRNVLTSFRQLSTHRQYLWSSAAQKDKRQQRIQDERRGLFPLCFAPLQL